MSWLIAKVAAVAIRRRFDPTQAKGLEATIGLRIRARARSIDLAIAIADGACTVGPGSPRGAGAGTTGGATSAGASGGAADASPPGGATSACATIGLADLIRLALGDAAWLQLLSSGRLELSGDPFVAMRLPALFRMPVSRGR